MVNLPSGSDEADIQTVAFDRIAQHMVDRFSNLAAAACSHPLNDARVQNLPNISINKTSFPVFEGALEQGT